jgi:protein-disulfide isomerase
MRKICVLAAVWAAVTLASDTGAPKIDKQKLEAYLRYAEGYPPAVKVAIEDPTASTLPGYFRLTVHLSSGAAKLDRLYYLTADAQHLINGSVQDLNDFPFQETLAHLPTDGFSFGPPKAKITIVIFSDFQCPYCQNFAETVRENVPHKYPNDVRVIYKDFPIASIHPWARPAAEAGRCLGDQKQDAFWAFHDWIFGHQPEVNAAKGADLREKALAIATEQKLNETKLANCIDTHATAAEVEESIKAGTALHVEVTPTVFINGRVEPGALKWATLDQIIQLELNRPKDVPGPGAM